MKNNKNPVTQYTRFIAETTGWSEGSSWFPIYELSYDTEEAAREAINKHKKTFHGNIQYRLVKTTTIREQLKLK